MVHNGIEYGMMQAYAEGFDILKTKASERLPEDQRFDLNLTVKDKTGEVHHDGQIWSQALWEIRLGYQKLGLSTRAWDTSLVQSQFSYAPDTSFAAAAKATYTTVQKRDGAAAARLVKDRFAARGITF